MHMVPSSFDQPWSIVLYLDEITPGNISAPMNSRKFVAFYWTFKELAHLIRSQDFWFHLGFIRTSVIKRVKGGYGAMTKAVLHTFINDVESFCHVGIAIDVGAGPRLLYAKPWRLLADGAALTATFDTTGASGTKACFCCANAMKIGTFDDADESDDFVPMSCADAEKFVRHTNESVWKSVEDVCAMASRFKKTQLKRITQSYGFRINPHGMLMDMPLREFVKPVDFYTQDWPHIFAQHGVGNIQLFHLLRSAGIDMAELRTDATTWTMPAFRKNAKNSAKQVFQPSRRDTKKKYWKCAISEFLLVAPMVLNFVLTNTTAAAPDEVELFVL
jgi:hypothetical protein